MAQTVAQPPVDEAGALGGSTTPLITPTRRTSHLGIVHVVQLIAVEVLLLVVLVAVNFGVAAIIVTAVLGAALAAVVLTRRQGRWLLETALLARRSRRRGKRVPDPDESDPRLAALRCVAPRLAVQDVAGLQDTRMGVGYDGEGWFTAAAVTNADGGAASVAPGVLARILDRHLLPGGHDAGPATASVQSVTFTSARAECTTWVAIRLDARPLAEVGNDVAAGSDHSPPQLARLVRRMTQILTAEGLCVLVLDAAGLLDALARCCDVSPIAASPVADDGGRPGPAHEEWAFWRSDSLDHASFWIQHWPEPGVAPGMLSELGSVPADLTSVSVRIFADRSTAGPVNAVGSALPEPSDSDRFDIRGLVRIAASAGQLEQAIQELNVTAASTGARLFRLDGEHAPALYATAPTGGGPQ